MLSTDRPDPQHRPNLIDATRMTDGRLVYIKRVRNNDPEYRIARWLSSGTNSADPRNHCVPLLDYIVDDDDTSLAYIVMPFLRPVNQPPFERVADIVDFVTQLLEVSSNQNSNRVII